MGLDMYLYKKRYVKNWDYMKPEDKHNVIVTKNGKDIGVKPERVSNVTEEVAYWRKANAIHRWFIENCANGEHDQRIVYVEREDLQRLLTTVNEVLEKSILVDSKIQNGIRWTKEGGEEKIIEDGKMIKNPEVAEELLPTTSGFFFGSTDYNNYYIDDLRYTQKMLTDLLAEEDSGQFGVDYLYEASW